MSETVTPKAPSAAEVAKQAAKEKLANRVEELKAYKGKFFIKKGSDGVQTFEIMGYAGIAVTTKGAAHLFLVEGRNPGTRWNPIAKEFLEDYEEIPAPKAQPEQEVI